MLRTMAFDVTTLHCPVCGEDLEAEANSAEGLAFCSRCRTPHHESCWSYGGGCAAYGCGSRIYEREAGLVEPSDRVSVIPLSRPRHSWFFRLAMGLLAGLGMGLLFGALVVMGILPSSFSALPVTTLIVTLWILAARVIRPRLRLPAKGDEALRHLCFFGRVVGRGRPIFRRDEVLTVALRRSPCLGSGYRSRLEVVLRDGRQRMLHEARELLVGGDAALLGWAEALAAWAGVERVLVDETRPDAGSTEEPGAGLPRVRLPLNMLQQLLPNVGHAVATGVFLGICVWFLGGGVAPAVPWTPVLLLGLAAWSGATFHRRLVRHRLEGRKGDAEFHLRPLVMGLPLPARSWFSVADVREIQLLRLADPSSFMEVLQLRLKGGRWLTVGLSTSTDPYVGGLMGPAIALARHCDLSVHYRDDPGAIHAYRPFRVGSDEAESLENDGGGQSHAVEELPSVKGAGREAACVVCRGSVGRRAWTCHGCGAPYHSGCWEASAPCERCSSRVVHLPGSRADEPFALFGLPSRPWAGLLGTAAVTSAVFGIWATLSWGPLWLLSAVLMPALFLSPLAWMNRKLFDPKTGELSCRNLLLGIELGKGRRLMSAREIEGVEIRVPEHGRFQELWIRGKKGLERRLGTFINLPCRSVDWLAEAVARFGNCTVRRLEEGKPEGASSPRGLIGPGADPDRDR